MKNRNTKCLGALALCSALALTACSAGTMGAGAGAGIGAIAGQAIGHNTESTLIGAAAGSLLGYIIGNEMDKYDRQQLNHMYERGVSGQTSSWQNPDNGNMYTVTPQPAYQQNNQWCRQAEIDAVIDGRRERTLTTACRNAHGQWELQR